KIVEHLKSARARVVAGFDAASEQAWQGIQGELASSDGDEAKRRDISERIGLLNPVQDEDRAELARIDAMIQAVGDNYYLKAMNCPHHHKLFAALPRSYRDLPLRLAEYGTDYRYEKSGELFGLMRVRSLQMNDAHLYMTPDQFEAEFNAVN